MTRIQVLLVVLMSLVTGASFAETNDDPYLEFEKPLSPAAVKWADDQSQIAQKGLEADRRYAPLRNELNTVALSPSRLPSIGYKNGHVFSFWQDANHVHGIYRRQTLADFKAARESWDVLLDLDALAKQEQTNWVWKSLQCLEPAGERCLLSLSPDGGDAVVVREYDLAKKEFVANGFQLPLAKTDVSWVTLDQILVATDFGEGSLTKAGYPGILKSWMRGQPLANASTVLRAEGDDMSVTSYTMPDGKTNQVIVARNLDFYHVENFWYAEDGTLRALPFPADASVVMGAGGFAFANLKSAWAYRGVNYPSGSLLSVPLKTLATAAPEVVFRPTARAFLSDWQVSGSRLYLSILDNVQGKLERVVHASGGWAHETITVPPMGSLSLNISAPESETLIFDFESYLVPRSLFTLQRNSRMPRVLRSSPSFFDASSFVSEQYEATSRDGTKVPYFVVHSKNWKLDGKNPTLQYGYGGFEISETPVYSGATGKAWLEKGGVYVLANIRGGAEFGPDWHTAALKENRQRAYDDFIAVSEDIIARKISSPAHLGIQGGSNGGLLVGATFVERPDLYNAVVCQVPLLDMIRYPLIAAGFSWEAEYGDPSDAKMREAILRYSPYQNVKAGVKYPKAFFLTSRTDDRVGSAHARKMAAKMLGFGDDVLFYEDPEGGHSGSDSIDEKVHTQTMSFTYLYQQLFD